MRFGSLSADRRVTRASNRFPTVAAVVLAVIALLAGACSDAEDPGDLSAFCNLLEDGIGLGEVEDNPIEFEALEQFAPPEIRPTIGDLRNAAVDLNEVAWDDLDALFAARFDPAALTARGELEDYAVSTCGIDLTDGPPTSNTELQAEIRDFLELGAAGRPWLNQLEIIPGTNSGQLNAIRAVFLTAPAEPGFADEVCTNLSGFLYGGARAGQGAVTVEYDGQILSQRNGPSGVCGTP